MITADAMGGVWQYTVDLARCLVQEGIGVMVATMGPSPSAEQQSQLPLEAILVAEPYLLEWQEEPWDSVEKAGAWLLGLRDEFRPDLVHLNGYVHAALEWGCPVIVVAHSCVFSWWRAVHGCQPPAAWDRYHQQVRSGLMVCEAVVAPSDYMAAEIRALYQVPPGKIRTIWNFSSSSPADQKWKEPFCLAAGRTWDRAKNFSLLSDVAQISTWPIHLAGGVGGSDALNFVTNLGRVRYQELLDLMARARVFLHPALYEPFGLAILEAARAGCCLVLADTASARELWEGAAFFLDAHDPAKWAEVLNRLMADPRECQRWGRMACEHSKRYSQKQFRESYLGLYSEVLKRRASGEEAAA